MREIKQITYWAYRSIPSKGMLEFSITNFIDGEIYQNRTMVSHEEIKCSDFPLSQYRVAKMQSDINAEKVIHACKYGSYTFDNEERFERRVGRIYHPAGAIEIITKLHDFKEIFDEEEGFLKSLHAYKINYCS